MKATIRTEINLFEDKQKKQCSRVKLLIFWNNYINNNYKLLFRFRFFAISISFACTAFGFDVSNSTAWTELAQRIEIKITSHLTNNIQEKNTHRCFCRSITFNRIDKINKLNISIRLIFDVLVTNAFFCVIWNNKQIFYNI